MKKFVLLLAFIVAPLIVAQAQEVENTEDVEETIIETTDFDRKKSDKQLKIEEKEAKKTIKTLKKQNKLERSILGLENSIKTDGIKLEKLKERHSSTNNKLSDVQREKLELKIAKLEMKTAKNKAKLKKLRKKL